MDKKTLSHYSRKREIEYPKTEARLGFFYTTESCKKHPKINFSVLEMLIIRWYNKTKISACQ